MFSEQSFIEKVTSLDRINFLDSNSHSLCPFLCDDYLIIITVRARGSNFLTFALGTVYQKFYLIVHNLQRSGGEQFHKR